MRTGWGLAAAVFCIAFACALALQWFLLKKKRTVAPVSAGLPPAHERALKALAELRAQRLAETGRVKEFFFELSLIVRRYLEERFSIRAPHMSTDEFLCFLRGSSQLAEPHKQLLESFMNRCDLVKFAKYGPVPREIEESFESARSLIQETQPELAAGVSR